MIYSIATDAEESEKARMRRIEAVQSGTAALDGDSLTIQNVASVANDRAKVCLTPQAQEKILASREVLEECAAKGQSIYGMTTNLGPYLGQSLTEGDVSQIQLKVILEHVVRQGVELTVSQVRAMMLARLNGFCKGTSGVHLQTANALADLLNLEIHPIVVAGSSVGASDLSEMAQIALVLIGLGEAEFKGKRMPGGKALAVNGLTPLKLAGKEGIALISNNGFSVGVGTLVLQDVMTAFMSINLSAATSLEAIQGNLSALNKGAANAKAHPGYVATSELLRDMLEGSSLWQEGSARCLQDPLSFRCVAPTHGSFLDAVKRLKDTLEVELNAGTDNPFVDLENRSVYSCGNFDTASISLGFDTVRIAMTSAINMLNERVQKLMNKEFTNLPTGLKLEHNDGIGLIPLTRLVAALTTEAHLLATPASIQFRSQLGIGHEDSVSLAPLSVNNTAKLADIMIKLSAVEILIACAALDMRKFKQLGRTTQTIAKFVKGEPLDCSNWDYQISRVVNRLRAGRFSKQLSIEF
jgi:histidine ammonia-lyase